MLIIGDAAHAVSVCRSSGLGDQSEGARVAADETRCLRRARGTGVAIEDGGPCCTLFQRRASRTMAQLFADYEALRRETIEKLYKDTTWRWENAAVPDAGWVWSIVVEWITMMFLFFMNLRQEDYFANDVEKLQLPG